MPFGLDISDLSLEVLELKKGLGKIKFYSAGRQEIPAGIFDNGAVKKKRELAEAIKKVCREAKPHQIRDRKVVVSLPEARIFTHIFRFPKNLKQKQIADILKFEVPNALPINIEEVYSDFLIIRNDGKEQEVFYAACPKKIIDDLKETLRLAGFEAVAFDMETSSTARALVNPASQKDGVAILDIGAKRTVIAIFDRRGIRSSVTVKTAGNAFTEEVSKRLKVKPEIAEELKRACGLSVEDKKCREGKVFFALQSLFPPIISEVKKSVDYYEKQTGRKVGKIFLCGGSRFMPGLVDYLKANLSLSVEVGKPYLLSSIGGGSRIKVLSSLMDVFGLAMRAISKNPSLAGINLALNFGEAAKRKRTGGNKWRKFFVDFIFLMAIVASGIWIFNNFGLVSDWFGKRGEEMEKVISQENPAKSDPKSVFSVGKTEGRIIEISKQGIKKFIATGEKIAQGVAEGRVTVFNKSSSAQSLVIKTRLISTGQILFRMKSGVSIPANSSAEVEVYADQEGPSGDIGPDSFYLPGLSSAFQKLVYAESKTAMFGGSVKKNFVSSEDIARAKESFADELAQEAIKAFPDGELRQGEILLPLILEKNIIQFSANPAEASETLEFELILDAKVKVLAVQNEFLKNEAAKIAAADQKAGWKELSAENLSFRFLKYDPASGETTIEINFKE